MKNILAFLLLLVFLSTLCFADRGPSTPEERKRFIEIAHRLEADPLSQSVVNDREWALKWLIEIPDVTVSICSDVLSGVLKEKSKNDKANLTVIYTMASAAFILEHPDQAKDQGAINCAAMRSILNAYDAVLKVEPKAKLKSMELLKQKQAEGTLDAYIESVANSCAKRT